MFACRADCIRIAGQTLRVMVDLGYALSGLVDKLLLSKDLTVFL